MSRRDHALSILRAHRANLRDRGIVHLALFGSTAREQDRADSDIDLLAQLDPAMRIGLFDFIGLERYLSELLQVPVDLVDEASLRPRLRKHVWQDRVHAF